MPDAIVVGLGAAGAATLLQLARRGAAVTGIDRHAPPHDLGSTHGESRITRLAIGEGLAYTPLVQRSHQIWRELEAETGADLLTQNGCFVIQDSGDTELHGSSDFLGTTVAAARRYSIPHELLDAAQIVARFPQFSPAGDERGCFEPSGGFVRPEACVAAQLQMAQRHGAVIQRNVRVVAVEPDGDGVVVRTDSGTLHAGRCVIAAGPWVAELVPPEVAALFTVYPQLLTWFAVDGGTAIDHTPAAMPVFIWAIRGSNVLYGVPKLPHGVDGVKAAGEQFAHPGHPDARPEGAIETAHEVWARLVRPRFPGLSDHCVRAVTCWYTTTPDMGFLVDTLPGSDSVLLLSACSGHGFKHSAALGEAAAELVLTGRTTIDLAPFRRTRFTGAEDERRA